VKLCSRKTRPLLSLSLRNKFNWISINVPRSGVECLHRNAPVDNHFLKHPKTPEVRRLQSGGVGKQHSLCSLQNAVFHHNSPSSQRRMSKQWSMPLSSSETTGTATNGGKQANSRTTSLSKSSSCRSAGAAPPVTVVKRHPPGGGGGGNNLAAEITIDVVDADDDVTMTSQSSPRRGSMVRNSSVNSERQLLDVYYDTQHRW